MNNGNRQTQGQPVSEEIYKAANTLIKKSGFCKEMGFELVYLKQDEAQGKVVLDERHKNPFKGIHGGVLYALADTVCGIAASSRGVGGPTVSGYMDYLRPVNSKVLYCTAKTVKYGKNLTRAECVMTDENGKELAKGYFVFLPTMKFVNFPINAE